MNLNMTVDQAAWRLLCRYTQSTLAASCACWIVPIATCESVEKLEAVRVWNATDQSQVALQIIAMYSGRSSVLQ